jgi:hypothetical protein
MELTAPLDADEDWTGTLAEAVLCMRLRTSLLNCGP